MASLTARAEHRRPLAYRRIVVPLTCDAESEAAMALAAELADDHGARITAVVVVEMPAELPLDAHMLEEESMARRTLEEARAIAYSRGVNVRTRIVRARQAGEAVVEETEAFQADLVVMLAQRRQTNGRRGRIFGKTVDYVLKHAACRVMVAAPPPPA
jgi:nucleotide-binding universal stress UspA family protein